MITNNIGYLLSDCARQLRRIFDERARNVGVTSPQARLLLMLETREGEQQGFYASWMNVEPITMCRIIDRMEEAELIERRPDPADRRAQLVFLKPPARAMTAPLEQDIAAMLDEIFADMPDGERDAFRGTLARLNERMAHMVAGANQHG